MASTGPVGVASSLHWWRWGPRYSWPCTPGAAAEGGHLLLAGISALAALALAGWVALTIVPVLARRTPLLVAFLPD